jgi:hypothetical protein
LSHPAGFVNSRAYTEHKILRIFWTGVKYSLLDNLDIAGAYYHYYQNDYNISLAQMAAFRRQATAGLSTPFPQ